MSSENSPTEDAIEIVEYDPNWPCLAEQEIINIRHILDDDNLTDIQHVGSTSIPNAKAKPIIDIYVAVVSIEDAKLNYVDPIISMGYLFWDENPNPEKLFFVKGMPPHGEKRTHHIHIVNHESDYWRDCIVFRDYLVLHLEEINAYSELKEILAKKYRHDREAYTDAKNDFIIAI